MKRIAILGIMLISTYASATIKESSKPEDKALSTEVIVPMAPKATTPPDCKPVAGTVNTGGGDNVVTKVVCDCSHTPGDCKPAAAPEKPVVKPAPAKPKVVAKKKPAVKPAACQACPVSCPATCQTTCPACPIPAAPVVKEVVVEKQVPAEKKGYFSVGVMAGDGPDGVDFYRYGNEYRARRANGIIVGVEADYTFPIGFYAGGAYINNDTKVLRVGYRFGF